MSLVMATHPAVHHISRCSIKPERVSEESSQPFHLNPRDIAMFSAHYIQKGLLFPKPPTSTVSIIEHLKDSLSRTLVHFPPLAGRLVTHKQENPPSYSVSLDFKTNPGVDFVHATTDVTIAEILSSIDVHPVVQSFFLLDRAVNHDAHFLPLLAVQVTELLDGVFIALCLNHVVGDGTSYWHFFNSWAEVSRSIKGKSDKISRPPLLKQFFLDGHGPIINLPFSHHDEFIERILSPVELRERFFHFSSKSIGGLKAKANQECNTTNISSFQALSAVVWRGITRARRHLLSHQKTSCRLAINNRSRLNPPLSPDYFGNCVQTVSATATVEEVLSHGIGWAVMLLHEAVNGHNDSKVRESLENWMKSPFIYQPSRFFDPCSVMMGSSPRFDMFGCEFGWGEAVAVRSGFANKFDGKVSSYPGRPGGGSVDLEVCLPPECMSALESDPEFMGAVSLSPHHHHQHQLH